MDHRAGRGTRRSGRGAGRRPGLAERRVLVVSFAISAVIHLAVILIYPSLMRREVLGPVPFYLPVSGPAAEGMEVIQVVEVDELEEPEPPPEPVLPSEPEQPTSRPSTPGRDMPGVRDVLVAPGPTAAERLRPNLDNPRLWGPIDPELLEPTLEQRLELELAGRIENWRDSLAAALEREGRATDWTFTDGEGGRWGVSEGKLHLGDLTIPLPFNFGISPADRDGTRRAWEWEEIQRAGQSGAVRDSWKDRAEAIRRRRDRERAEARPDTSGVRR